ncbi:MAG: hypothetical protein O2807_12920 [bacterium]|nr:hypothetical protein [bacterium]
MTAQNSEKRILQIGENLHLPNVDVDDFYTDKHFMDYDIVIVDPWGAMKGEGHDYPVSGDKLKIKDQSANYLIEGLKKFSQKFLNFINRGKTAIVFVRKLPILTYSYQDRTAIATASIDLNKFMPWGKDGLIAVHGTNIGYQNIEPYKSFFIANHERWEYKAIIKEPFGRSIAHVYGVEEDVLATEISTKGDGYCLMLPYVQFNLSDGDSSGVKEVRTNFVSSLVNLTNNLQVSAAIPDLPDWTRDYRLPGEAAEMKAIGEAGRQVLEIQEQIKAQTKMLEALRKHKYLFSSCDTPLEKAVDRALSELGFKVEPGPKNRVDRIAEYNGQLLAVEIQGVKNGAKEDHARSLNTWVAEVEELKKNDAKGLLVVNAFRETPLGKRNGNLWPGETLSVCSRHMLCAMTGLQLLGLCVEAKKNPQRKGELIQKIFDTSGEFPDFKDWREFLDIEENNESETE